ncbi:MAG: hypothetical protein RLZZ337_1540 [Bacteroidota bacterium]
MVRQIITLSTLITCITMQAQNFYHQRMYTTFDNLLLSSSDTFNNGADRAGGFAHVNRYFPNEYDTAWGTWSGWSLSNRTYDTTSGFENQYSAKPGHGVSYTPNYAVGYGNTYIKLNPPSLLSGAYFTNNTSAYFDMKEGSAFSKKFGGESGNDSDYFKLKVQCYLKGELISTAEMYLADYRNADNSKDYILDDWMYLDFNNDVRSDVMTDSVAFSFESSDNGQWGMNTPAYFCMDDFNALSDLEWNSGLIEMQDETYYNGNDGAGGFKTDYLFFPNTYDAQWDSWGGWAASKMNDDTTRGFTNQYSTIAATTSPFFVNSSVRNEIRGPYFEEYDFNLLSKTRAPAPWPINLYITNSTYAYWDMLEGSGFSKKFGGATGQDPDYLRVLVKYTDDENDIVWTDTVYLADYRFENSADDYVLKEWIQIKEGEWTNIRPFHKIQFEMQSSDNGQWGMNTPAYFCLQYSFNYASVNDLDAVDFNLYPNPTIGEVYINGNENISAWSIYSLAGEELLSSKSLYKQKEVKVDVSTLINGVYFIQLKTESGIATKKFIKQ